MRYAKVFSMSGRDAFGEHWPPRRAEIVRCRLLEGFRRREARLMGDTTHSKIGDSTTGRKTHYCLSYREA